jgi:hypothetical protein
MANSTQLLRLTLATLAYRTRHATIDAPESFGEFRASDDLKNGADLLYHMTGCVRWTRLLIMGEEFSHLEKTDWAGRIEQFHSELQQLDDLLAREPQIDDGLLVSLFQGPMLDAMTHTGQLLMMRRLSGSPVRSVPYYKAPIEIGRVGIDQTFE